MSQNRNAWSEKRTWFVLLGFLLVALLGPGIPVLLFLMPDPNACTSETKKTLSNLAGFDFEAVETDCDDVLVKDAAMRVFVTKAGESEKSLLFRYTPVWWVPPPEITVDAQHRRIAISVAMVEDIDTQLPSWNGMTVSYDIWKPDDPRLDALRRGQR